MKRARSFCRGIALVIVLAFLVLMSAFILGFFTSVTTELKYSKTAANTSTANQLADSAVNLVMSQIVEATQGADPAKPTEKLAWASQPGMIRTYDATGGKRKLFKLYSSDNMVLAGGKTDPAAEVPDDWSKASNAGLYTDLNSPVLVEDVSGLIQPDKNRPEKYSAIYPIMDPFAENSVEGFKIEKRPGFSLGNSMPPTDFDPTAKSTVDKTDNPAPMPVKWLYVLKDGSIQKASATAAGIAVDAASTLNPIVGRIAFWTDDETAKVNINTASEGVYWDIPRIFSEEDSGNNGLIEPGKTVTIPGLALCQPATGEFQRYPGHPATTSLSTVFAKLGIPSPVPGLTNNYGGKVTSANANQLLEYSKIAPRIVDLDSKNNAGSNGGTRIPATPLLPDSDRLYASIDELMFKPSVDGTDQRITNTSTNSQPKLITKSVLEKARFFITASSSGPEVTLFNTPRVSIWPVWGDSSTRKKASDRTPFDKLSAFCASTGNGNYPYYFARANARSSTEDYDGISRNPTLYRYLQAMTSPTLPIPGFGGSFSEKYTAPERDQILTSIFDYIRCTNLSDKSKDPTGAGKWLAKPYVSAPYFRTEPKDTPGGGEVIPIRINNTQGFGRFATVTEFALIFYKTQVDKMRAAILLQFGTPGQGNIGYQSGLKYRMIGLNNLRIKNAATAGSFVPLQLKDGGNYIEASDLHTMHGRGTGGIEGPAMALINSTYINTSHDKFANIPGGEVRKNYPFFSNTDVPVSGATFDLDAANITIEIRTADTADTVPPVQTLSMAIPQTSGIRVPPAVGKSFPDRVRQVWGNGTSNRDWSGLIQAGDTVLAMQLAGTKGNGMAPADDNTAGDMRMTAARQTVPASFFRPHQDWTRTTSTSPPTNGKAHGLVTALGLRLPGATSGALVAGVWIPATSTVIGTSNYMNGGDRQPAIPSRVSGVAGTGGVRRIDGRPGDWDTGIGTQKDGAYINKADEGDQQFKELTGQTASRIPYVQKDDHMANDSTTFSPTRQIPSALMFGSIPTGVQRNFPWQTLLFCPKPEDPTHPGNKNIPKPGDPPDHLIADLFWMPVVEPYAISQPFSTNGKINMNYQIQPFTYIKRSTGLQAVMKSTRFMALKAGDATTYKPHLGNGGAIPGFSIGNKRFNIEIIKTLADFDKKFTNDEIFKSPTEICEMNLIPGGNGSNVASSAVMGNFWAQNTLTGDNLREKPYADIYPRLTTKSNTYTVHVCVQTLKKTPSTDATVFVDPDSDVKGAKDQVLSEYRGSTIIERYIDPNDKDLPDFASLLVNAPTDAKLNIDQYYKFRVVSTKRFAP